MDDKPPPLTGEIIPHGAPMGRPSSFTQGIADLICDRLAMGESLRTICRDDTMPDRVTVHRWLLHEEREDFRNQYARAREIQADSLFDEMNEIADDGTNDWLEKHGKDGELIGYMVNGEAIQRSRLRIDTRKWQASKLKPKKYGEKLDLTTDGERITPDLTDAAAKTAALLALAARRKADDEA